MRVNDIRLKPAAQTDQCHKVANEREWAVLLALAYLRAPHAIRVEKRIVMASGAGVDNLMALPRLPAGQIDCNVDVPIRMPAMLDQMEDAHCLTGTLSLTGTLTRGFVKCRGWHLLISCTIITIITIVNNSHYPWKRRPARIGSRLNLPALRAVWRRRRCPLWFRITVSPLEHVPKCPNRHTRAQISVSGFLFHKTRPGQVRLGLPGKEPARDSFRAFLKHDPNKLRIF